MEITDSTTYNGFEIAFAECDIDYMAGIYNIVHEEAAMALGACCDLRGTDQGYDFLIILNTEGIDGMTENVEKLELLYDTVFLHELGHLQNMIEDGDMSEEEANDLAFELMEELEVNPELLEYV